jgi:hypothetical protein
VPETNTNLAQLSSPTVVFFNMRTLRACREKALNKLIKTGDAINQIKFQNGILYND